VRVVAERVHELPDVLVHEGVEGDVVRELVELRRVGSSPLISRYAHLEEARFLGQLLDGVAAVPRMPLSPSMKVILLFVAAVFVNAGS
jgi:hypothetical protein